MPTTPSSGILASREQLEVWRAWAKMRKAFESQNMIHEVSGSHCKSMGRAGT